MTLRPLIGHHAVRRRLAESLQAGRLPASLLLQGNRGIGKQRLALWLGQMLLCERARAEMLSEPCSACVHCRYSERLQHPDLHWFFPRPRLKDGDASTDEITSDLGEAIAERMEAEGLWTAPPGSEAIYIATMRALISKASLKPALAGHKVFVVGDAERMVAQEGADQAANAFLKLLEEPPPATTLILTSSEPGALLPTIRSRVVTVRLAPLRASEVGDFLTDQVVARRFAGASNDDLVARASGAPGMLLAGDAESGAKANASRLLDAALREGADGASERIKVATRQGVAGARGAFSDTLDALTILLHDRARQLVTHGASSEARRTASAIVLVEQTKARAQGNVSPQLLTASLLDTLHRTMRP